MAVHIIADSSCDITQAEAARMGIQVPPVTVCFGAQDYRDGIDLLGEEFYTMLAKGDCLPTTSQVTPWQFQEALAVMQPGDGAVIVTVSGKLSGTLQSARIAASMIDYDRIHIIDSLSGAAGSSSELLISPVCPKRSRISSTIELWQQISSR